MFKNASHAPSVIVIVSCYKPSGSFLNFFELILKAYISGVPNRTAIFQDRAHQSFICCLFHLLWTSVNISSQEAKGPVSLSANIADMCIPSQIICDSDQDQDQDSILVKRRNDNHSPGPVIRELVPSSHQRSELSNTILCIFSG